MECIGIFSKPLNNAFSSILLFLDVTACSRRQKARETIYTNPSRVGEGQDQGKV